MRLPPPAQGDTGGSDHDGDGHNHSAPHVSVSPSAANHPTATGEAPPNPAAWAGGSITHLIWYRQSFLHQGAGLERTKHPPSPLNFPAISCSLVISSSCLQTPPLVPITLSSQATGRQISSSSHLCGEAPPASSSRSPPKPRALAEPPTAAPPHFPAAGTAVPFIFLRFLISLSTCHPATLRSLSEGADASRRRSEEFISRYFFFVFHFHFRAKVQLSGRKLQRQTRAGKQR